MTYPEAENKIIQAYFRDEIKPMNPSFCFCGTLNGSDSWCIARRGFDWPDNYTRAEYAKMEAALLNELRPFGVRNFSRIPGGWTGDIDENIGYEDALFIGMSKALEVLKQIHIDRGENIDPVPFKKRELV